MKRSPLRRHVATSHGVISVQDNQRPGTPLVMVHGNSSCGAVFDRQWQGVLADNLRLISLDLPGHGSSANALDPERTYTLPGLASAVTEVLGSLGIDEAVLMGWSLGGHVAIEMIDLFPGLQGLIITGTPPIRRNGFAEGFLANPAKLPAAKRDLSTDEIEAFARAMFGEPVEPFLRAAIMRSDGKFRERLFAAAKAGAGIDQREAVERMTVPIAVINGSRDPLVNLAYVDSVAFGKLWGGKCHRLAGEGHAPFWHSAPAYDALVADFMADLSGRLSRVA